MQYDFLPNLNSIQVLRGCYSAQLCFNIIMNFFALIQGYD